MDEKDLQAIGQMMDKKLENLESKIDVKLDQQKKEIMGEVNVLLENVVTPRFNLLAENQQIIMDKLERLDDMDIMDTRISALEAVVKKLNRDITKLKQVN